MEGKQRNEQYVNEYLQKQKEDKLKIRNSAHCSLKSGFFKSCTTTSNEPSKQTTKEPSFAELCSEPPHQLLLLQSYYSNHLHQT